MSSRFPRAIAFVICLAAVCAGAWGRPRADLVVFQATVPVWPGQEWEIYTMDVSTGEVTNLTRRPGHGSAPSWSPNGEQIVFVQGQLAVMDWPSTEVQILAAQGRQPDYPTWSPDGKRIAYSAGVLPGFVNGKRDIFVVDLETGVSEQLTSQPREDDHPTWSPDGRRIAFESNRDPEFWQDTPAGVWKSADIYVMDADGANVVNLTKSDDYESAAAWSPDGTEIAFVIATLDARYDLFVMNADGTSRRRLTRFQTKCGYNPAWTPDGARIVFEVYDERADDGEILHVIDRNGDNLRPLPHHGHRDTEPSWYAPPLGVQPAGKGVVVWGALKLAMR
ncbi:MAG: hypothetical protein ABGY41_14110 [Candidatus Poribacteria bacterium]